MGIRVLSDAQWKTLVTILDERKPPPNERLSGKYFLESWIIDTRVSNHMTGMIEFFIDICDMAPVLIKLPDGRFTTTTKHGRVCLQRYRVSRDVIFNEIELLFTTPVQESSPSLSSVSLRLLDEEDDDFAQNALAVPQVSVISDSTTSTAPDVCVTQPPTNVTHTNAISVIPSNIVETSFPSTSEQIPVSPMPDGTNEPEILSRGHRKKIPPMKLADYVITLLREPFPSTTQCPLDNYVSSTQFSEKYQAYILAITSAVEPQHYKEAVLDEKWRCAMTDEIVSLEDLGTWIVDDLPPGKKALECKWVYRIKLKADGTLERYKARLVVLGNNQTEGIDYT